jgi:ABC transporter substrate binding protein (PQQ-dependent alcohol dehydrogenase system)
MRAAAILMLALMLLPVTAGAAERTPFAIGYLEIAEDPRYAQVRNYTGLKLKTAKRPFPGAESALRESRVVARALGLKLGLEQAEGTTPAALAAAARTMHDEAGIRFFIVDADADTLLALADAIRDERVLLFNISETADRLRRADCRANLMHVIPSRAMLTDATAQYLALNNWRRVLMLRGELPADSELADSFTRSARKFGLKIVAAKAFVLSNDPRERGQNNVRLLTAEPAHDIVFLADSYGEFGRYVPYQTHRPRPVVGTEGLVAAAWHWAWERHGAPQLNQRFEKQADREMQDADWAAWAAMRLIVEALIRTNSTEFDALAAYLKGEDLTFDAYKGNPANFRPWNNQLRQPVLLHTHNAVAARAPLDGFLHRTDVLDTLGIDEPESSCEF